jgi:hypothetical protein
MRRLSYLFRVADLQRKRLHYVVTEAVTEAVTDAFTAAFTDVLGGCSVRPSPPRQFCGGVNELAP